MLSVKPWLLFGLLVPIIFFIFQPVDPMLLLGVLVIAVVVFFSAKWAKEMPAAKKATEEAEAKGQHFTDIDPEDESHESPLKRYKNKFYPMFWSAILSACMLGCSYQMIYDNVSKKGRTVAAAAEGTSKTWNASNIEMVHLKDSNQYVTNSDSILSAETQEKMNAILQELDTVCEVKTAFIICRQVEDGDTYQTAVNLINQYGIGSKSTGKGVCVVVAYDQHQYTIATSRAMEGDLTDAICSQMGRTYILPYMKSEQPDSAMLYLTQGLSRYVHDLREKGKAEVIAPFQSKRGGFFSGQSGMNMLIILVLCFLFGYFDDKNKWTKPSKTIAKVADTSDKDHQKEEPRKSDVRPTPPVNKGGSYGGGTSGGGGATGTW